MPNIPSQKHTPKCSKGINKKAPRELIIKALEKRKWLLLLGGNSKDRRSLVEDIIDKIVKRDVKYAIEKSYREKNEDIIKKGVNEFGKARVNKKIREIVKGKFKDSYRCVSWKEETTYLSKRGKTIARLIEKDLKGHNDIKMKELLFGNIDYHSFGELESVWYGFRKIREEERLGLFSVLVKDAKNNVLFLNNLNCKYTQTIEYIQAFLEYMRLPEGELSPDFLQGKLIIGIKSDDRKLLPKDGFEDTFEVISLDEDKQKEEKTGQLKAKKRRHRISDKEFKKLYKEVEAECPRALGEMKFFKKLSEKSKSTTYDKTGRGYTTWQSAKKRYYQVFPSKKANQ
ncbi:MAG: hypothetical protein HN561_01660 [Candidatus Scalindua sp.]|nr:hypothetical protein [Candidatus Scalindua sp.]